MMSTAPLTGVIPPLVTPLNPDDSLDTASIEALLNHVIDGGVSGVFILGSTGEFSSLSYSLRKRLIDRVCREVDERVPVLVGISDTSMYESFRMAQYAADSGADAVVLTAPYYFPLNQEELYEYTVNMVEQIPLPVFLYNMPKMTQCHFDVETTRRLMQIDKIIGMKESSGNMLHFHQLKQLQAERKDWTLLVGPEELMPEAVLFGAHGGVHGGSNIHPKLYVDLYEAAACGNLPLVRKLHQQVLQLAQIYQYGRSKVSGIPAIKTALSQLGLCQSHVLPPLLEPNEAQQEEIKMVLSEAGLVTASV
ncbi:MAG: dihydrodipicolinate synthase family protein [Blastopirellula sp.]|nr:MAG: dihydrodipicolinate synthase family protein [Blastopirellula sp.]